MTYTPTQLYYAALALRNFVLSVSPLGGMVPWSSEEKGALLILNKWDQVHDALACGQDLYNVITAAGYGDKVTLAQCDEAANAVLAAAGVIQTRTSRPPAPAAKAAEHTVTVHNVVIPYKDKKEPLSSSETVAIKKKYEGI